MKKIYMHMHLPADVQIQISFQESKKKKKPFARKVYKKSYCVNYTPCCAVTPT